MWELLIQYLAVVGVVLNLFMVYVAVAYSHPHFGQFKWALAVYSTLSACSSFILFLSIPIETVVQSSFVIFSYGGLVASSLGPCLFLLITQLWLVSVIVLFLWRYIALCRGLWAVRIKHRPKYRFCLVSLLSSQLVLSLSCSFIMTRDDELSSVEERQLASQLEDYTPRGYIVYRLTTIAGCLGILYHLALLFTFLITVVVFGRRVWNRIGQLRRGFASFEAKINQQILTALVIQVVSAFTLYHVPSFLCIVLGQTNIVREIPPISPLLAATVKIIDPLIWILLVQEYRQNVLQPVFCSWYTP